MKAAKRGSMKERGKSDGGGKRERFSGGSSSEKVVGMAEEDDEDSAPAGPKVGKERRSQICKFPARRKIQACRRR